MQTALTANNQWQGDYLSLMEAELARRSLYHFTRLFWREIDDGTTEFIDAKHVKVICDALQAVYEGSVKRLIINIPPGYGKSKIGSVAFPAWIWANNPAFRMLYASYDQNLAEGFSLDTRAVILSTKYQTAFADADGNPLVQMRDDQNRAENFKNTSGGFRMATSVEGRGTGIRVDMVFVDDPLNAIHARSDAHRDGANRWFTKAIASRLKDPSTGRLVVVMQRLHADDLSGHLLRKGGYEHLCLPSEFEPNRKSVVYGVRNGSQVKIVEDWRTKQGEVLFPRLYPKQVLDEAKVTMGDAYSGQHQQRPAPEEGGLFKKKHWRFWVHPDANRSQLAPRPEGCFAGDPVVLPARFDRVVLSLDAAFKDKKKSDFVSFTVAGISGANRFVLDNVTKRASFLKTLEIFASLLKQYPRISAKLVEDKANGTAIIDTLKSKVPGIIAIEPEGGKESRAQAAAPSIESGNWFLPEGAPWLEEFIDEFRDFPNGLHDDRVDSVSQLEIWLSGNQTLALSNALAGVKW